MKSFRAWCFLLVAMIVLSLNQMGGSLSTTASAEGNVSLSDVDPGSVAAVTVNGVTTGYSTFASARDEWKSSSAPAILTLLKNATSTTIQVTGEGLTLALNGYTLTGKSSYAAAIANQNSLIISGPGEIAGYYCVDNVGSLAVTGAPTLSGSRRTFCYTDGSIDLTQATIGEWSVYNGSGAAVDVNAAFVLPEGYNVCNSSDEPLTTLSKSSTGYIVGAPVAHTHTAQPDYRSNADGTHAVSYSCCDEVTTEVCTGGIGTCLNGPMCGK